MKSAYFEVIHEDYHDDGNPYSATSLPDERIPNDDPKRIRRLRNGLIALTLAISCLTILSYIAIGLHSAAETSELRERVKMMTTLNGICVGAVMILFIPLMVVVYRLSRALGNSRVMSILYLVFSAFWIGGGDRTPTIWWIIPLGAVIIPFILFSQAQGILLDQPDETDSF